MPVSFADVMRDAKEQEPELEDERLESLALRMLRRCGLEVSRSGDVYNPAEGAYRPAPARVVPRDQKYSARRRR